MENQSNPKTQGSENEPKTEAEIRQIRIKELLENQEKRTQKIEEIENEIKKLKAILVEMQKGEQGVKTRKENLDPEIEALIDNLKIGIQSFKDNTPGIEDFKNSEVSFKSTRGFAGYERHYETRVYINPESIETLPEERKAEIIEQLPNQNLPAKKYPKIEGEIFGLDPTVKYVKTISKLEEQNNPYFIYIKPNYSIDNRGGVFSVLVQFEKNHTDILNLEVLENFRIKFDEYINNLFTRENHNNLELYKKETINKIKTGEITNEAKEESKRILKEVVLEYENKDAIQEPVQQAVEDKKDSEEKQEIPENSIEQITTQSQRKYGEVPLDKVERWDIQISQAFGGYSAKTYYAQDFRLGPSRANIVGGWEKHKEFENNGYVVFEIKDSSYKSGNYLVAQVGYETFGGRTGYSMASVLKTEDLPKNIEDLLLLKASEQWLNTPGFFQDRSMEETIAYMGNRLRPKIEKLISDIKNKSIKLEPLNQTKEPNPEPKRDGRENYEGWETRYHHDIEADGKSMKIAKETKKQTPMSLYELKEKNNEMVLFLIENESNTNMLIDYRKTQIEPLFDAPYQTDEEAIKIKLIKTVRPTKFRKEGNLWVLEEKGEVEYIK